MHKLARKSFGAAVGAGVAFVAVTSSATRAEAHSIPRLYAEIGPATAWDPVSSMFFTGGTFMLGLGVDPERDALIARADFYATWGRNGAFLGTSGGSILYRIVLRDRNDILWTLAMGPGVLVAADDKDVRWGVGGVRGELGVRFGNNVGLTAYALTGLVLGDGVRVPVGGPLGLALELGAP